jgi:hypothetical protein
MIATGRMGRLSCREVAAGANRRGAWYTESKTYQEPMRRFKARRWPSVAHRKVRH